MCLISFRWQPDTDTPLILAANRDEFINRPAAPMHQWQNDTVIAGKDLTAGGTWLGFTADGRFAALTNYRDMRNPGPASPETRGNLTLDYLRSALSPEAYLTTVAADHQNYAGFNLLVGDKKSLFYYSNTENKIRELKAGLYGLSNALLDTPWPKVNSAREKLEQWIESDFPVVTTPVSLLNSRSEAPDHLLPDTGIGQATERLLSCEKIIMPGYGTRCSTGLIIRNSDIHAEEITWDENGQETGKVSLDF